MKAVVDNKTGEDFALSSEKQGQTQEFIKKTAHDLQAFKDKILAEQLEKRTGKKELKENIFLCWFSMGKKYTVGKARSSHPSHANHDLKPKKANLLWLLIPPFTTKTL
jgi:hypothetical protein